MAENICPSPGCGYRNVPSATSCNMCGTLLSSGAKERPAAKAASGARPAAAQGGPPRKAPPPQSTATKTPGGRSSGRIRRPPPKDCPGCRGDLRPDDRRYTCPECKTVLHFQCYRDIGCPQGCKKVDLGPGPSERRKGDTGKLQKPGEDTGKLRKPPAPGRSSESGRVARASGSGPIPSGPGGFPEAPPMPKAMLRLRNQFVTKIKQIDRTASKDSSLAQLGALQQDG